MIRPLVAGRQAHRHRVGCVDAVDVAALKARHGSVDARTLAPRHDVCIG